MNDEETVALIAGGHAFGKSLGMVNPEMIGPAPEAAPLQAMGLGWKNPRGSGFAQYTLTNDFFRVVTSMDYEWKLQNGDDRRFNINKRDSGETAFTATRCDLIFGANAQLRQISEVYAGSDGHARLVREFVAAWHKVMMLDRFDVPEQRAAAVSAGCC